MAPQTRFEIIYPPIIKQHLKSIEAKYYSLIRESLETQLQFEPAVETKNRKPLKRKAKNPEVKLLSLIYFLGLVTYFVHGAMNNFLDTDKASVPFWAFAASIVALDIYHNKPVIEAPDEKGDK